MSPELRHLRALVVLAEELNFSAAAQRLFVSQQSLSRTIQQLERELGMALFDRTTRSVELTPAGRALLQSAAVATAAADDVSAAARRLADGQGSLPLRADVSSGGLETGALILEAFRRDAPDISVQLAEHGVTRGLELLGSRLDLLLGIATHSPDQGRTELIRREQIVVGMAETHPLAELDRVPVRALAEVELLLPSDDAAKEWVELVNAFCREAGVRARRWPGATHGTAAATAVVREGRCIVPTARWADPPAGIAFRPLVDPTPILPWSLMWSGEAVRRRELQVFLEVARKVAAAEGWLARSAGEPRAVVDRG